MFTDWVFTVIVRLWIILSVFHAETRECWGLREQEIGYNIGILLGEIILLVYVDVGVELIKR